MLDNVRAMTKRPEILVLASLAAIAALEPVGTQMLLPALPSIQAHFEATASVVQLTLSLGLLVMSVTELIYGPWSDRIGRRPLVILGVVLFLSGNLLSALAPSIEFIILGRAIQAAGVSAGVVLFRVIAVDLYKGDKSGSVIALTQALVAFATMFAPVISGVLTDQVGWRSTFAALSILGVSVLALVVIGLKESHPPVPSSRRGFADILGDYRSVAKRPLFAAYALHSACTFAAFFAFMAAAPHVIITIFGENATSFGLWMLLAIGGFIVGNLLSVRFGESVGADRMILTGTLMGLATAALQLVLLLSGYWTAWAIFVPGAVGSVGAGMATPNSQALAVRVGQDDAGTASGLVGFLLLVIGGLAVQVTAWAQNETPYPMMLTVLVLASLALVAITVRRTTLRDRAVPVPG